MTLESSVRRFSSDDPLGYPFEDLLTPLSVASNKKGHWCFACEKEAGRRITQYGAGVEATVMDEECCRRIRPALEALDETINCRFQFVDIENPHQSARVFFNAKKIIHVACGSETVLSYVQKNGIEALKKLFIKAGGDAADAEEVSPGSEPSVVKELGEQLRPIETEEDRLLKDRIEKEKRIMAMVRDVKLLVASEDYDGALRVAKKIPDGWLLNFEPVSYIAETLADHGNFSQALEVARTHINPHLQRRTLGHIARAMALKGDDRGALELVLEIPEEERLLPYLTDHSDIGVPLFAIARLFLSRGNVKEAQQVALKIPEWDKERSKVVKDIELMLTGKSST
jgi:hypothetical protein